MNRDYYIATSLLRVKKTLDLKTLYVSAFNSKRVICIPVEDVLGINAEFGEYCDLIIKDLGMVPIENIFSTVLAAQAYLRNCKAIQINRVEPDEYSKSTIEFCGTGYTNRGDDDLPNQGGTT